jgi:hypothetical protein
MVAITELIKEKRINLFSKNEWKDSPTTPKYTDFSKLDLKGIEFDKEVKSNGIEVSGEYENLFDDEDPLIRINRQFHNIAGALNVVGDKKLFFLDNSSVIGSLIINMEKDSDLSIDLGRYGFMNLLVRIVTSPNSKNKVTLNSSNGGATYIRIRHALAEGSELELVNKHIKDSFLFLKADGKLEERSSLLSKINVYADNGAHYDCVQDVIHEKESISHIIGRGVIDGPSVLIFRGMLKMNKEKCSGNFETKTLNISEGEAFTDSVPMLDISANNVSAKHSSSIENIDENQLFYLMSRGFKKDESKKLIINSILNIE